VTNRLREASAPSPEPEKYATLVAEALLAFQHDVMYAVQVAESARSISTKGRKPKSKL
jgi:hypothetical protein